MTKYKGIIGFILTVFMIVNFAIVSFAETTQKIVVEEKFTPQSFTVVTDGYVEEIYINENREVFVNGRNITIIGEKNTDEKSPYADDEWTYAGMFPMKYDLSGLSVAAGDKILTTLGFKLTASTITAIAGNSLVNGVFQTGAYFLDEQYTYYKNIHQSRPDMKIVHEFSFIFEMYGNKQIDEYLGSLTTYG